MTTEHSPQVQRLIEAYRKMLHQTQEVLKELAEDAKPRIKTGMEMAGDRLAELGELSKEEAERVGEYLKKDIVDAARYIAEGERELADWARLDLLLLEDKLKDTFNDVVDQARLDLTHMQEHGNEIGEWHSGEVTGPGTLKCEECGQLLHFHEISHIPPCPKCHGAVFHRPHAKE